MQQAIFLIIAFAAVILLFIVAMALKGMRARSLNKEEYQTRWLKIENGLKKGDERGYSLAILEADKLLDHALIELGVSGKTMGERLKKASGKFSDINKVWHVHKLRNQIAHEQDFQVDYNTASRALVITRHALKDLGAI